MSIIYCTAKLLYVLWLHETSSPSLLSLSFSPLSWNHVAPHSAWNNQTAWQNHPWLTGHLVIFPSWAFTTSPLLQVCQTARRPDARRGDDRQATRQRMVPPVILLTPNRTGCSGPHYWFTSTASPKSIPVVFCLNNLRQYWDSSQSTE